MRRLFLPARSAFSRFAAATVRPKIRLMLRSSVRNPAGPAGELPPSRVAHEGSRIGAVFFPVAPGSATALKIDPIVA